VKSFWTFVLVAAPVWAQTTHQHHPPRDAAEYIKVLEDPKRDVWQLPHQVIMALEIRPGETIADIGAGSGYFTRRLARHAAKVYAVDIDRKLLEAIRKDAPANVETVLARPDDASLPPGSVDTIFFCNVMHHIDSRPAYLEKLKKALKPGGRVVNVDFYKKPLPVGPPEKMKLSEEEVEKEFAAAGFRKVRQVDTLPYQYFLVFAP
jgi:ubiquinone/menaquinone biosynthesis C-methylase UbiE